MYICLENTFSLQTGKIQQLGQWPYVSNFDDVQLTYCISEQCQAKSILKEFCLCDCEIL